MTQNPAYAAPAVTVCFAVKIDDTSLGSFNSCDGLGVEVVLEQREEGGNNGFVWQLPTRLKYSNVKLSRPICNDTTAVMSWLSSMTTGVTVRTASISAMAAEGQVVRWTGPSLNLDSPKVAVETLEIAHHGFGPAGG